MVLTEALEERGWKVKRRVPVPGLEETAAEVKLTLPAEYGRQQLFAEFFMPRRQPQHLVAAGAMAIHRAAVVPFLVIPSTLEADTVAKPHRWLLYAHDREIAFEVGLDDLASRLAGELATDTADESTSTAGPETATTEESASTGLEPGDEEGSDHVELHLDRPARVDRLGRQAFAVALAKRLRRVVAAGRDESPAGSLGQRVESAFMVHLHAPWGAGKTTVLGFLGDELEKRVDGEPSGTVVRFNAWRHQSVEPPWWSLLERVFRDALPRFRHHPLRWLRLWLGEQYRRLATGQAHIVLAAGIFLCLAALAFYVDLIPLAPASEWLAIVGGPALTAWGAVSAFSRTLLRGSADGAQGFVRSSHDPMQRVARHFRRLVRAIGRPTILLVDDIDRCDRNFVVRLLEGIQTLLGSRSVIVVVAGDQRWIHVCYETVYSDFVSEVGEPGRRLGSLFLEKAFQMSVALPRLSDELQNRYWGYLIGDENEAPADKVESARAEALTRIAEVQESPQLIRQIGTAGEDKVLEQAIREEVVKRLADREVERGTEKFLSRFAPLLEPNPRSLKRLVNAYGLLLDIAILSHVDIGMDRQSRIQLALWAIVGVRWPLLEELLAAKPELADLMADVVDDEKSKAELEELVKSLPGHQALLGSEQVRRVFNGDEGRLAAKLDAEAVRRLRQVSVSTWSAPARGEARGPDRT